ncbi:hypothetical protein [Kitasatospora sp. NPDC004531]
MGNPRTSRPAAVAAALAAVLLALASAPAHAADDLRLDVVSAVSLPSAPDSGDATAVQLAVAATDRVSGGTPRSVTMTYDTTGLAGVATFVPDAGPGSACTAEGQVHTCTYKASGSAQDPGFQNRFHPTLTAVKGAAQGAAGHLRIGLSWTGEAASTTDVTVYAGGPKLEFDPGTGRDPVKAGKPGSTVEQSLKVTNNGTVASGQLVVAATLSPGLSFAQKYANCSYGTYRAAGEALSGTAAALCTVNTSVEPGRTVTLDPIEAVVGTDAFHTGIEYQVLPGANVGLEYLLRGYAFTPASGSGPRLTAGLPEDPAAKPGPPNLVPGTGDHAIVRYLADNHADFSAHGAWTPTDGGRKGVLTVTARNGGPASIWYRSGNPTGVALVTLTPGATVSGALPEACRTHSERANVVVCNLDSWVPNGAEESFDLRLAVADPAARPTVVIALTTEQGGHQNTIETLPYDAENADNVVALMLGSATSTATPSTPPGGGGGQTGTPGGSGSTSGNPTAGTPPTTGPAPTGSTPAGGLASTGSEGTGTMLGLGTAAIVLGGTVIAVVTRRRRGSHS